MRRLTLWIGTAGILASGLLSAPVQAAQAPTGLTPLEDEAAVRVFESSAQTKAALGFYTDATTGDLVALLGADAAGASPRTFTTTEGLRVRIEVDSQITSDDVEAVKERLGSLRQDKARFPSANIQFWFDPSKRRVVAQGTPDPQDIADALGGFASTVDYEQVKGLVRESRHSDTAPFWGGAETKAVGSGNNFDCTTGFVVKNASGTKFLAIAGHCFVPPSTQVFSPGNGQIQGTVSFRAPYPQFDVERISGKTYAPSIYVGAGGGTGMHVSGASDPVTGRPIYCHSGAATLEKCNHSVTDLHGGQACNEDGCTNDLMIFDVGDGSTCAGDSGAPFYLKSGGNAYIRGMVIGGTFFCNGSSTADRWTTVATQLGVSIAT